MNTLKANNVLLVRLILNMDRREPDTPWWGCKLVQPLWEPAWNSPRQLDMCCVVWPSCATSGCLPKGFQLDPVRKMYTSEDHHISPNMSVPEGHILTCFPVCGYINLYM